MNWNRYESLDLLVPFSEKPSGSERLRLDYVVRAVMHLIRRMRYDGGWPKFPKWKDDYPYGDVFSAHSRAFPVAAYLWAYLATRWEELPGKGWRHVPTDADIIYDELQKLRRQYVLYDLQGVKNLQQYRSALLTPTFFDRRPDGTPYLAYSAHVKELTSDLAPRGVFNTHAHALHFAWFMARISELRQEDRQAKAWRAVVDRFHRGSKKLFVELYPALHDEEPQAGLVNYALNPNLFSVFKPGYNKVVFGGLPAGYQQTNEYEPEFVDVVERVARLDFDPTDEVSRSLPDEPFIGRLCRTFPAALAFTSTDTRVAGLRISRDPAHVGPRELLAF